jgi:two-component system, OmpR family, response regulator
MTMAMPQTEQVMVLFVEDDHELVELLGSYLSREGFAVTSVDDGTRAIEALLRGGHHIVVLDVMLPGCDGFDVLKMIRAVSQVPVLMLTARGDDMDKILGLEQGADDYVPKPCSPRELSARLRAILKRGNTFVVADNNQPAAPLVAGRLTIWAAQRRVTDHDEAISLTGTEFSILEELARNAGKIVSKERLSSVALGREATRFDRSIDMHIHSIRSKLRSLPDGRPRIATIVRKGYQLVLE